MQMNNRFGKKHKPHGPKQIQKEKKENKQRSANQAKKALLNSIIQRETQKQLQLSN